MGISPLFDACERWEGYANVRGGGALGHEGERRRYDAGRALMEVWPCGHPVLRVCCCCCCCCLLSLSLLLLSLLLLLLLLLLPLLLSLLLLFVVVVVVVVVVV